MVRLVRYPWYGVELSSVVKLRLVATLREPERTLPLLVNQRLSCRLTSCAYSTNLGECLYGLRGIHSCAWNTHCDQDGYVVRKAIRDSLSTFLETPRSPRQILYKGTATTSPGWEPHCQV